MPDIGYGVPTVDITVKLPVSIKHYHDEIERFFAGMVFKLHVNAHKPAPRFEDLPTLMLRLMGEVGELTEQLFKDTLHPNAAYEAYDTANSAFLVYLALLRRGAPSQDV